MSAVDVEPDPDGWRVVCHACGEAWAFRHRHEVDIFAASHRGRHAWRHRPRGATVNSQELASHVEQIVGEAQSRILGVGDQQYSIGDKQKFELIPLDALATMVEEEALDLINYSVMMTLRVRALRDAVQVLEAGKGGEAVEADFRVVG